jgi:hypothetical protein
VAVVGVESQVQFLMVPSPAIVVQQVQGLKLSWAPFTAHLPLAVMFG